MHLKTKLVYEKIHWLDTFGSIKVKNAAQQNYW